MSEEKPAQATSSIEDQIRLREGKAAQLRERSLDPYPAGVHVTTTTGHVREVHASDDAKALEAEATGPYAIAGRVMAIRTMGKATFLSLRDRDGDLQAFVKKDKVGEPAYETLKLLDSDLPGGASNLGVAHTLYRALAEYGRGHPDEAKRLLDEANDFLNKPVAGKPWQKGSDSLDWPEGVEVEQLRREVERLLAR